MMKKLFTLLLCTIFVTAVAHEDEQDHYSFRIREKKYTLSDEFEMMDINGKSFGMVTKRKIKFPGRTIYQLWSPKGEYEGRGITNLFCFGVFLNWATEIYVYDDENPEQLVGWIDGQFWTTEDSKFSFYHANGERVGIAYLDEEDCSFSLKHPENDRWTLADFNRKAIQEQIDPWDVSVYEPEKVDKRLIKVFAAFIVDRQNHFHKKDN